MIGKRIKDALRTKDKSVAELAQYLGITEQSVYRYLRDEVEPSVSTIFRIADFTGFSYLYFISRTDSPAKGIRGLVVRVDGEESYVLPLESGHTVTIEIQ